MQPFLFTDAADRASSIIDYKVIPSPQGEEPTMLHRFGLTPYCDLTPRTLQQQPDRR